MQDNVDYPTHLLIKPKVLLLDEPFAALDEKIRFGLQDDLLKLWQSDNMTVIFVTHSLREALYLSEKILIFDKIKSGEALTLDLTSTLPKKRQPDLRTSPELNEALKKLESHLQ